MTPHPIAARVDGEGMVRTIATLVLALVITLSGSLVAHAAVEIEDYAPYQPQTRCSPKAKAGTLVMSRFVHRRFGGGSGSISRPCRSGGTSEHKEGRAYDWPLDATRKRDRQTARAFMDFVFAADKHGNEDARARRMGIMYVIWNDHVQRMERLRGERLPELELQEGHPVQQDAAAPQPRAHLAEPQGRPRRDQLVRRPALTPQSVHSARVRA